MTADGVGAPAETNASAEYRTARFALPLSGAGPRRLRGVSLPAVHHGGPLTRRRAQPALGRSVVAARASDSGTVNYSSKRASGRHAHTHGGGLRWSPHITRDVSVEPPRWFPSRSGRRGRFQLSGAPCVEECAGFFLLLSGSVEDGALPTGRNSLRRPRGPSPRPALRRCLLSSEFTLIETGGVRSPQARVARAAAPRAALIRLREKMDPLPPDTGERGVTLLKRNGNAYKPRRVESSRVGDKKETTNSFQSLNKIFDQEKPHPKCQFSIWVLLLATMGLSRFEDIRRFLRFDDKRTRDYRLQTDHMAAFRYIWDLFIVNCKQRFIPNDCVTIDEQLVPFRGRCKFLQYMPSKPAKYGIKIFWMKHRLPYLPKDGWGFTLQKSLGTWFQDLKNMQHDRRNFTLYKTTVDKVFQMFPPTPEVVESSPDRCMTCAVVGNSGNLNGSRYGPLIDFHDIVIRMNHGRTKGYERDVGTKTTHHVMYPESAINLDNITHLVLFPFKMYDLEWLIRSFTPAKNGAANTKRRANKDLVMILNPAFMKYVHEMWLDKKGKYPSTGFMTLVFSLLICDEVNVFGFGADSNGNWNHYFEILKNKNLKTGPHPGNQEHEIIQTLHEQEKIHVFKGRRRIFFIEGSKCLNLGPSNCKQRNTAVVEVNVFGFGADSNGNWNHYFEILKNKNLKTGPHPGNQEHEIIQTLHEQEKIHVFKGRWHISSLRPSRRLRVALGDQSGPPPPSRSGYNRGSLEQPVRPQRTGDLPPRAPGSAGSTPPWDKKEKKRKAVHLEPEAQDEMESEKYLPELMAEKDTLDPSFQHSLRLLDQEIEKIQKDEGKEEEKFIDVVINKNMKLGQKVLIPVKQFPKQLFNFVGKLLGPRGNSLKRLQEDTLTKMSILGKGSMRDKEKEEELRQSGEAKYHHLNEDLHVLIEVFAPPAEAYARMGHALEEIKKFLIPLLFGPGQLIFSLSTVKRDYNDEIRQAQLQELTYLNGGSEDAKVPSVRGKSAARGRGTPVPGPPRSRGGVPPLHAAVPRGAAPRGAPPSRAPSSRGRGVQRARGAPPTAGYRPAPPIVQDTYGEYRSLNYLSDFGLGDGRVHLRDPSLRFLIGRQVGGIEEILEVFLPPSDNVPSRRGQQLPTCTVNSVGRVLLPPSEAPDGLPESLRGRPIVLLHGLTELLPDPSFCLQDRPGCGLLGLPVPVNCVRSPTGQHGPIGLLLQPDGIPYFRCPPPGSGVTATTGTRDPCAHNPNSPMRRQWRQRTWSTRTQCLQPPSESHRSPITEHQLGVQIGEAVPPDHAASRRREATLSFTGVNSNTWRLSWEPLSKPTPAAAHPGQLQSAVEGPAPLKELGSRAQAMRGGIGSSRPPPRLLPKPHCTCPSWTFLRVVSLLEGGPTPPFRAEPGRVPWAKTRPPGARLRAPTQAWLQGGAPCLPIRAFFKVATFCSDYCFVHSWKGNSLNEKEYDDSYGTAYDDQGYESYDNNYSNQGQNSDDYYEYGHSGDSYDSYGELQTSLPPILCQLSGRVGKQSRQGTISTNSQGSVQRSAILQILNCLYNPHLSPHGCFNPTNWLLGQPITVAPPAALPFSCCTATLVSGPGSLEEACRSGPAGTREPNWGPRTPPSAATAVLPLADGRIKNL
ncbi:hypothetical protein L3Q82_014779 [Scortum barcoo]|uniref:Uncharacterized protein n=1 Tax=Scortum barcoo TaxID=214431 RepID=A0ACB8VTU5_9TELE|nr:hypothetical protein L3Q82_014779 [Scortum barcoo]